MNRNPIKLSLLRWVACAACVGPLAMVSLAQTNANRAGNAPVAARGAQAPNYTPEELAAAIDFMKQHGPHRLNAGLNRLPGPREQFERNIVNQKRNFDRLQAENPQLYEVRVREYELNDDIFELCREMKIYPRRASSFEPQLKTKVSELFDLGIKDQQLRIDKLEKDLASARKALDTTQKNREQLVEKNFTEVAQKGVQGAQLNRNAANAANPGDAIFAEPREQNPPEKKK